MPPKLKEPSTLLGWRINSKLKVWFEDYAKKLGLRPGKALELLLKELLDLHKPESIADRQKAKGRKPKSAYSVNQDLK